MKAVKKEISGSVKVNPSVYKNVSDFCKTCGIKVSFFASEALAEKLEREKLKIKTA